MNIQILCVGKIKEKYYTDAAAEYLKRLSRYCRAEIVEVSDEQTPDGAPEKVCCQIRRKEGARLIQKIRPGSWVIALAIEGKAYDSPGLASHLEELSVQGKSDLTLIIGGSLGLSDEVLAQADEKLSFSRLTFPHQLMRVILLEQIYRSFRIIHHEPYHK